MGMRYNKELEAIPSTPVMEVSPINTTSIITSDEYCAASLTDLDNVEMMDSITVNNITVRMMTTNIDK